MRKKTIFILIFALFIFINLLIPIYATDDLHLEVEKIIENTDIKTGDEVQIILKFNNPFNQEIPIKIVDKNIFANNGINIECLEQTIPPNKEILMKYSPIVAYKSGKYTLDEAQINYTNPIINKEETIKSNSLKIKINEDSSSNAKQTHEQGITTIYQCDGTNMQSTSYSSSSSGSSSQSSSSQSQQSSQQKQQQQDMQNKVQNNQMNQNTNAIKEQIKEQAEEQKQIKEEFKKNLEKNSDIQKKHQELLNQGYNATNGSINPSNNNTGDFQLNYKKPNGEAAHIKGQMQNGTMENLMGQTEEDRRKIIEKLEQNEDFQKYNEELKKQGLNKSKPIFNQISQNNTQITIPYKNNKTNQTNQNNKINQTNITANYINNTIQNIVLEKPKQENQKNKIKNILMLLILIAILGIISYFAYRKYFKKQKIKPKNEEKPIIQKPINYKNKAKQMIKKAKKLFESKKQKDAYEKVSQAIRFYLSFKLNIKKEITATELLIDLKRQKNKNYLEIQKCLNMCGMVEFAKYKPNKKDFDEIIKVAEKIIMA